MNTELLSALTKVHSVSGCESAIADIIKNECEPYADEMTTDSTGNLFVRKKGEGKRIMLSAHMDSIGMILTYIEKEGYLRFAAIGGLRLVTLPGTRVRFSDGTPGIVMIDGGVKPADAKVTDMYIDIGAASKDDAEKLVTVGDTAVYDTVFCQLGDCLVSPYMDNRVGCYVLIESLRRLKKPQNDCWFVFSTQEEVGLRGVKPAAYTVGPDMAVAVDVAGVADTPKCEVKADTAIGEGAIIKLMDASVICHGTVVDALKAAADSTKTKYQLDAGQMGGTDAGAIHISRGGVPSGILGIPTRYIHTPSEIVSAADVDGCVDILTAFLGENL